MASAFAHVHWDAPETTTAEREAQKQYWLEHSEPTVEAMMLDSKASEIDRLERPEVRAAAASPANERTFSLPVSA